MTSINTVMAGQRLINQSDGVSVKNSCRIEFSLSFSEISKGEAALNLSIADRLLSGLRAYFREMHGHSEPGIYDNAQDWHLNCVNSNS